MCLSSVISVAAAPAVVSVAAAPAVVSVATPVVQSVAVVRPRLLQLPIQQSQQLLQDQSKLFQLRDQLVLAQLSCSKFFDTFSNWVCQFRLQPL